MVFKYSFFYLSNTGSHLISALLEHLKLALMKCILPCSQLEPVNSTQVILIEWYMAHLELIRPKVLLNTQIPVKGHSL